MDDYHEKCVGVCCGSPTPWNLGQGQEVVAPSHPYFEEQKRSGKIKDGSQSIGSKEGGGKVGKED